MYCLRLFIIFLLIILTYELPFDDDDDEKFFESKYLIRKIEQGLIRGKKVMTENGVEGYTFLSIPIAEPPIGQLRFKKPILRRPWKHVWNTTDYTVACYYNSTITSVLASSFNMSEDCIQLHVFTNKHCLKFGGCSVAYYIHGGDFSFGTPLMFNQEFLVDNYANNSRNVIMVTASFRQAAFACLNLNWNLKLSSDLNVGLHDIVFQLQWIQNNIEAFGGDPSKVTLMGHSGGAGIVENLAVSPVAQKYFNQLAVMSRGAQLRPPVPDGNQGASRMTAKLLGCALVGVNDTSWDNVTFVEDVIECLRNKSALEISSQQMIQEPQGYGYQSAIIDYGDDALFPTIYEVLEKLRKPVPLIIGTTSKEFLDSKDTVISVTEVDQIALQKWCNMMLLARNEDASESAIQACMIEYNTTSKSINLYNDVLFFVPTLEVAISATLQNSPVYLYQFEYQDIGNAYVVGPGYPQYDRVEVPVHSMELIYLMGQHLGNFTDKDKQIQYLYSQIFVDFINNGSPNTIYRKWDKFNPKKLNYFVIDYPDPTLENPGMTDGYHSEAYNFWTKDIVKIAGERKILTTENNFFDVIYNVDLKPNNSPSSPTTNDSNNGTNWQLFFWITLVFFILTLIILITHMIIASKRKRQYQQL